MAQDRFPRRYSTFTDQHGRKWGALIEVKTTHPCGPVELLQRTPAGNPPPYVPDIQHLRFSDTEFGTVRIDYDAARSDRVRTVEQWTEFATKVAHQLHPESAGEHIANPGPAVLSIVGPKPEGPEFIDAARQGNKFALGLVDNVPQWAKPILDARTALAVKPADVVPVYDDVEPDEPEEEAEAEAEVESPKPRARSRR